MNNEDNGTLGQKEFKSEIEKLKTEINILKTNIDNFFNITPESVTPRNTAKLTNIRLLLTSINKV